MTVHSKPTNSDEVYKTMISYCKTKQINLSDSDLKYLAEDCYLFFESRGWKGVTYWPAVAMRWVLNNKNGFKSAKQVFDKYLPKQHGKTVRERILEIEQQKNNTLNS